MSDYLTKRTVELEEFLPDVQEYGDPKRWNIEEMLYELKTIQQELKNNK